MREETLGEAGGSLDARLKVATWNVERPLPTQRRLSRLRDAMVEVNADVWVLTETHDCLSPGPGYHSHSSGEPDRAHVAGERWVTLWSRLPLVPCRPTSDASRSAAAIVTVPGGGRVVVFGTVLPWLGSSWRGAPAEAGEAFGAALEAQREDWARLRGGGKTPLLLLGDLNQDLAARHYYGSARNHRALDDALRSVDLVCLTAGADDPVRVHAPSRASIDHICATPELRPRAAPRSWPTTAAPPRALSDHFGVCVDLAWVGVHSGHRTGVDA